MLRFTSIIVFILTYFAFALPGLAQEESEVNKLCSSVVVDYEYDLNFTTSERRLVCGSSGIEAWENIPLRQAQFHMQNFLESRGYHHPVFTIEDNRLYIQPGIPTLITELRTEPFIEALEIENYWLPRGKPLTPSELNTVEKWVNAKLSRLGYPCPAIRSLGDPETGEVVVAVDPGSAWTINKIDAEPIPYVRGGMLDRYRAFDLGDPYDSILLELSAQRLISSDVVVNTQYIPLCHEERPGVIKQITLAGKPRLVTFGFGFDSEELFIIRASWGNSRFSETASSLILSTTSSYIRQKIEGTFNWYYLPIPTHHYLTMNAVAKRRFERDYETRSLTGTVAPAWTIDRWGLRADYYLGPSLKFESTQRGEAPATTRLLTLDLSLNLESHRFEYNRASPKTGYQANLYASLSEKSAASDISVLTYRLDFTRLWTLLDLEPEIWVLGLRGNFATTRPGQGTNPEDLPFSFRYSLGGSNDLRGFARQAVKPRSIDNDQDEKNDPGALTTAYLGSELRLNNILPYQLQPFVFADWGWIGEQYFKVYPRLYWSPGVGLRWESPIGSLRTTIGRGYVAGKNKDEAEHLTRWQFYFSLGEQF